MVKHTERNDIYVWCHTLIWNFVECLGYVCRTQTNIFFIGAILLCYINIAVFIPPKTQQL
jgi:hypothetical protein